MTNLEPVASRIDCLTLPAEAWANGGGVTRTLARATDTDGTPLWRISLATLQGPSTFSRFPGLDRTFVLIDQPAVDLRLPDGILHARQGQPVRFSGDDPVRLDMPADTFAQALNVMTQRGRCRARVEVFVFACGEQSAHGERGEYDVHDATKVQPAATHFLVSLSGVWRVACAGMGEVELAPLQALRLNGHTGRIGFSPDPARAGPRSLLASVALEVAAGLP